MARKLLTSKPRKLKAPGSQRIPKAVATKIKAVRAPKSIVYRIRKGARVRKGHIV